jgi:hypothetical protein
MHTEFKAELLKLNGALLFLYIDLLGVLTDAPEQYAAALTPVVQTLQNMQHLLNLLRPLQVRYACCMLGRNAKHGRRLKPVWRGAWLPTAPVPR